MIQTVTDTQFSMAICLPTLALVARMSGLESRMLSLDEHVNLAIGKIGEIDTRLSVLKDRSSRS